MLVIPCTSIKEDSPEATEYELDIRAKIRKYPIRSRMQLSDMRVVDLQRLDIRKRFCNVITDKKWLCFVIEQILSNALKYTEKVERFKFLQNRNPISYGL